MTKLSMTALITAIIADGMVDEAEVKQLREVFLEDGVIDTEEAEALFQINDAVSGNANHESYEDFFVEAISSYLLEDETSPGVVDEEEGNWLADKIEGDSVIDALETRLLTTLQEKATEIQSTRLAALITSVQQSTRV